MSEVVVYTAAGARVWLSSIATVYDVSWSTGWGLGTDQRRGGCLQASWKMDLPANATPPVLTPGRKVEIWDGPSRVWAGLLAEPDRGEPWELHASGLADDADEYLCLDAAGNTTSIPQTAVNEAIARGLRWTNPSGVSGTAFSAASTTNDLNYLGALLDAYASSVSQRWGVFGSGELVMRADPTVPKWVLTPGSGVMGVADDEYASHVYGRYVSAVDASNNPTAYATAAASDADAAARWGRREYPLDLTGLGLMSAQRALDLTTARLKQASARMGFTNAITASRDELTTLGGTPARLSQVRAGDMLRIYGILDSVGNLAVAGTVDVVLGEVRYDDGADSIYLAPVGLVPRSLTDVLAAPAAPESRFSA